VTREKLTANVSFPLKGLKLGSFSSAESGIDDAGATYDLFGVINHLGSMVGGHYTSYCKVKRVGGRKGGIPGGEGRAHAHARADRQTDRQTGNGVKGEHTPMNGLRC
jgi:Ubiquitin carboxyl-terminal hydrolase